MFRRLCFCQMVSMLALGHAFASDAGTDAEPQQNAQASISLPESVAKPTVQRSCTPANPRIADEVRCLVSVEHSSDFSVSIEVPTGWSPEPQSAARAINGAGKLTTDRVLSKTPLSMRKLKLFGFTVSWKHVSGAVGTLSVPNEYVSMRSVMAEVDDPLFRTLRNPTPNLEAFWNAHGVLPLIQTNWWLLMALSVLTLAIFLTSIILYIQRVRARRKRLETPWVDPRPAHVIAFTQLEALAEEHMPEQGFVLEFYLRLSDILRVYLDNRLGIAIERGRDESGQLMGLRFPAATTEEIESVLRGNQEISQEGYALLLECLSSIDYVVFGGVRPHVGQTEADRRRIRFFVELTKNVEGDEADAVSDSKKTASKSPAPISPSAEDAVEKSTGNAFSNGEEPGSSLEQKA